MFTVKANKSHCRGRGIEKVLEDRKRSMLRSPLMPQLYTLRSTGAQN